MTALDVYEKLRYILSRTEAAALIDDYARRVPRAMLLELLRRFWSMGNEIQYAKVITDLVAKYSVEVEE